MWPIEFRCLIIEDIYRYNKIGLKQLPWGRPVEVERRFVESKVEKKRFLLEKRREIKLMKVGGNFSGSIWESSKEMWRSQKRHKCGDKEFFVVKRLVNLSNEVSETVQGSSSTSEGK